MYVMEFMKNFLLPLQNMVRADLFSGSLAVWSVRGEAAHFAPPHPSRAPRGEGRIPLELFLKYTARKRNRILEPKLGRAEGATLMHSPRRIQNPKGFSTLRVPRFNINILVIYHIIVIGHNIWL